MSTLIVSKVKYTRFNRLENKIIDFAKEAIKKCPTDNKSFHCCLLVYKNIIVSYGINKENVNYDLAIRYTYRSVHAEFDCIRRFLKANSAKDLKKIDLYSVRITRKEIIKNAKPCRTCESIIDNYSLRRVYYTTDEGSFMML